MNGGDPGFDEAAQGVHGVKNGLILQMSRQVQPVQLLGIVPKGFRLVQMLPCGGSARDAQEGVLHADEGVYEGEEFPPLAPI
ncbi:MAG: hypothetical protein M0031_01465 [Thermaerobacter sp.]|nr:hypothetical protein [Thermaerobacter sp.]